jgi:Ni,Fe-hydrogenase III component G
MNRNEISKEELNQIVRSFFDPKRHHLVSVHGLDIGGQVEIQWVFSNRNDGAITVFASIFDYSDKVPSFRDVLPSSWIHEAEIKDMFGLDVDGAEFGLFLEKDGIKAPLRKKNV